VPQTDALLEVFVLMMLAHVQPDPARYISCQAIKAAHSARPMVEGGRTIPMGGDICVSFRSERS